MSHILKYTYYTQFFFINTHKTRFNHGCGSADFSTDSKLSIQNLDDTDSDSTILPTPTPTPAVQLQKEN